jgi:hypothetical protein
MPADYRASHLVPAIYRAEAAPRYGAWAQGTARAPQRPARDNGFAPPPSTSIVTIASGDSGASAATVRLAAGRPRTRAALDKSDARDKSDIVDMLDVDGARDLQRESG